MTHPQQTTLITGAGKRIGACMARHLAAAGHGLVLHYHRSQGEVAALAEDLRQQHSAIRIALVQADLEDTAALPELWDGLPSVTNIIHNASHYARDTIHDFSAAQLRTHLAVNLEAPLLLSQGFLAQLPEAASGNIVVLGDGTLGWSVSPEFFTYAVSKHSWAALIDLLASACAPRVRANMIALAPTLPGSNDPDGLFERLAARAPLQRTGTVEDVLSALDYLLISPSVTGQTLALGNGMGLVTARIPK